MTSFRYIRPYLTMMMEAVNISETSVNFYRTARCNNPEDSDLYIRRRENVISQMQINNCVVSFASCLLLLSSSSVREPGQLGVGQPGFEFRLWFAPCGCPGVFFFRVESRDLKLTAHLPVLPVKNAWSNTSFSPYDHITYYLIKRQTTSICRVFVSAENLLLRMVN